MKNPDYPELDIKLNIPRYSSNWSYRMAEWLRSIQGQFQGAHEWATWIAEHAADICESWCDRNKPNRPRNVMVSAIDNVADMLDPPGQPRDFYDATISKIEKAVDDWANERS